MKYPHFKYSKCILNIFVFALFIFLGTSFIAHAGDSALTITTSSLLPNGQVNSPYSAQVSATGGTGSYAWRISSGYLPSGLSLIAAQCFTAPCQAPVTISGTPTTAGTYIFTVEVSSSPLVGYGPTLVASKEFSLTVAAATSALTTLKVTAWILNVRSGPGTNYKIITRVRRNNVLESIGNKNGWFRINLPQGRDGWVYGKFVR
ncbi:MAG: Ig domain protein [Parcubacteria group bacterium Gr01-1014_30]|nr:MAG: Ig domain protein [Parcubacteria group bacterium Gr01-1014_30]